MGMNRNCDNCIFHGQWCEEGNKCPLFKEDQEPEEEPEEILTNVIKTHCRKVGEVKMGFGRRRQKIINWPPLEEVENLR